MGYAKQELGLLKDFFDQKINIKAFNLPKKNLVLINMSDREYAILIQNESIYVLFKKYMWK